MPRWKVILLNARALICGVIVAVVLVSAYTWVSATAAGGQWFMSPAGATSVAAVYSAVVALIILVVCVPLWLIFERAGWTNRFVAAGLGFLAPLVYSLLDAWSDGSPDSALDTVRDNLPYALCGAVAGLTIWFARPRPIAAAVA